MAKYVAQPIGTGFGAQSNLNQNFEDIEDNFQRVLYRDGSSPNQMEANIDMNGNTIYNAASVSAASMTINGQVVVANQTFVTELPDPTGQGGKFIKSDGAAASWQNILDTDVNVTTKFEVVVATVAAMKALTGLTDGCLIKTKAYRTNGNPWGGGVYKYNSTPTGVQDNFIYHNQTTGGGQFELVDARPNVYQAGAYGDGVTDDTTFIQAAIDAAASSFLELYLPAATFLHSGLNHRKGVKLKGAGAFRTILKNTNGTHSITIDGRLDSAFKYWSVEDMTILHSGNPAGTDGLRIYDTSYGLIKGVVFDGIVGKPQHWEAVNFGCYNNMILNCRYTGCANPSGAIYLKGVGSRGVSSNVWLGGEIIGGAYGIYIDTDGGYGNYFGIGIENGATAGDPGTALIHCADGPNTFEGYLEVYAFGTDGIRLLPGGQDCTFRPTAFGFAGSGSRLNNTSTHGYNYAPGPAVDYTELKGIGLKAGYLFGKVANATSGSGALYAQVGDLYLNTNRAVVGVSTTTETDLYSHTITANSLVANSNGLRMSVKGDFAANANTKTLRGYLGGTLVFSTAVTTNGTGWEIDLEVIVTTFVASPGLSTVRVFGKLLDGNNTVKIPVSTTTTKDLGTNLEFKLTGQGGATNDIVKQVGHVRWKF